MNQVEISMIIDKADYNKYIDNCQYVISQGGVVEDVSTFHYNEALAVQPKGKLL